MSAPSTPAGPPPAAGPAAPRRPFFRPVLWRYFSRRHLRAVSILWVALTLLLVLFETLRWADDEGAARGALLALLRAPQFALDVLPFACALGAVLAVCGMVTANEMPVLSSAGMSPAAVAAYNAASMAVFVAAALALGEFVMPAGAATYAALKDKTPAARPLWLKDGADFVRIEQLRVDGAMRDIAIYHTDEAAQVLLSITVADSAAYVDGEWELRNVRDYAETAKAAATVDGAATATVDGADGGAAPPADGGGKTQKWDLPLRPASFGNFFKRPRDMALSEVYAAAAELGAAGQDARPLRADFWRRLEMLLALPLFAACAVWVLRADKRRYLTPLAVFAALLASGAYYLAAQISAQTAVLSGFSPLLLLPPAALAAAAALGAARRRR